MLAIQLQPRPRRMPDFREQIYTRLKKLKKSRYWLSQQLPEIGRMTIYNFLREDEPSEIGSDKLEAILTAIEAEERRQGMQK